MQNKNLLEEEVTRNAKTVLMSNELNSLLDNVENNENVSATCLVKTLSHSFEKSIMTKEVLEDTISITFLCNSNDLFAIEKNGISSLDINLFNETLKSYNKDEYMFDICWRYTKYNYYVDIFINKRGVKNGI
tara:strand:- start:193 stop:588 length:396 start_codon:yes stop_codon:yes gene_type:complete